MDRIEKPLRIEEEEGKQRNIKKEKRQEKHDAEENQKKKDGIKFSNKAKSHKTCPFVWTGNRKYIGGCDDTLVLIKKLKKSTINNIFKKKLYILFIWIYY